MNEDVKSNQPAIKFVDVNDASVSEEQRREFKRLQKIMDESSTQYASLLPRPEIPESLLDSGRIQIIIGLLQNANVLDGGIAEVGVYKGGVAHWLNKYSEGKPVYLFDTFEGIPMKGEHDLHPVGDFGDTSFKAVKKYFEESENVKVIQGIFPDSARKFITDEDKFCFVHLDADQYESTINSLKFFYPKMVMYGVIVFDDYGWLPGVNKAVDEFFEDKPEEIVISTSMQCFIIKK